MADKKQPPKWIPGKGKVESPAEAQPLKSSPEVPPSSKPATAQPTFKAPPAPLEQKEEFVPKRVSPQVVAKKTEEVTGVSRRTFLSWVVLGWLSFTTATVAGLTAFLRFLFPKVLFEPPTSFKVGFPGDYGIGKVDTRWTSKYGVWIGRTEEGIYALIAICTHLGCTPNWLETENKFKCPCHGSGFYMDGINFEGPAPRPLERAYVALADDGQIIIDKKKKFFYEKGEWNLPGAILKV